MIDLGQAVMAAFTLGGILGASRTASKHLARAHGDMANRVGRLEITVTRLCTIMETHFGNLDGRHRAEVSPSDLGVPQPAPAPIEPGRLRLLDAGGGGQAAGGQ